MNKQFWQDRWTNNQIAFHNAEANPLLVRHFNALKRRTDSSVFVPLCGKSQDLRWLAEQGCRVIGAELSRIAVEQFFEELGAEPRMTSVGCLRLYEAQAISIYQGSVFDLTPEMLGTVDFVYDRAALVALPKEMRDLYVPHLVNLTSSAQQLLISYEYDQTCDDGPPFSVTEHELRRLYEGIFDIRLLERQEVKGGLKGKCPAVEAVWNLR
ncbi:MAG TPA: thiopurine S-methyltransferase [Granulicella sp.]